MIVRLHYADGKTEDHPLKNGEHFADYIRRVDVPGSQLAFMLRGQQIRYLSVTPGRQQMIRDIELVKGPDVTAPSSHGGDCRAAVAASGSLVGFRPSRAGEPTSEPLVATRQGN